MCIFFLSEENEEDNLELLAIVFKPNALEYTNFVYSIGDNSKHCYNQNCLIYMAKYTLY